jgi:hypothetical protein
MTEWEDGRLIYRDETGEVFATVEFVKPDPPATEPQGSAAWCWTTSGKSCQRTLNEGRREIRRGAKLG